MGTALDVWEVIEALRAMSEARLLVERGLTERQSRLTISYDQA